MSISTFGIGVVYLISNYSEINHSGFVPNFSCERFTQLSRVCQKNIHQKISDFVSMFAFVVFKIKNLCII